MNETTVGILIGAAIVAVVALALMIFLVRPATARREQEAERAAEQTRRQAREEARDEARTIIEEARVQARQVTEDADRRLSQQLAGLEEAKDGLADHRREVRAELTELRTEIGRREQRLARQEERLTEREESLERDGTALAAREAAMRHAEDEHRLERERIAALTADQARAEVLERAEHDARLETATLARDLEATARRTANDRARSILVTAMQRMAGEQTAESTISVVALPSEDMKGRIIGREGRNIRTFEQTTGANLVIDDSPDSVLVSCFDPVRREVARLALSDLVADGRIHPSSIEEAHARSSEQVAVRCQQAAEDALLEVGITDLDPALVEILGQLRYRTSYGQNVLKHLIECAHLARMIAAELGLDPRPAARAAFLHDIGKALTHEAEGSHALVGADLARRHGEHPDVVHAIEAHHNEVDPETVEAHLVQVVDAISGARPGARRESVDQFMTRMTQLEKLARSHDGVGKVFAMQAGRDVRVMVQPDKVDDRQAQVLARTIAQQYEQELTYPGQIKVTVIRESRASETAR